MLTVPAWLLWYGSVQETCCPDFSLRLGPSLVLPQAVEQARKLTVENEKLKYRNKHLINTVRCVCRALTALSETLAVLQRHTKGILELSTLCLLLPIRLPCREMEAQTPPTPPPALNRWSTTPWDEKSPLTS